MSLHLIVPSSSTSWPAPSTRRVRQWREVAPGPEVLAAGIAAAPTVLLAIWMALLSLRLADDVGDGVLGRDADATCGYDPPQMPLDDARFLLPGELAEQLAQVPSKHAEEGSSFV